MTSYSPTKNDVTSETVKSRKRIKELEKELSNPKIKGQTKIVEEIAIEQTKINLWQKGYWILREQQLRGPADLYAYKILNYKKIIVTIFLVNVIKTHGIVEACNRCGWLKPK